MALAYLTDPRTPMHWAILLAAGLTFGYVLVAHLLLAVVRRVSVRRQAEDEEEAQREGERCIQVRAGKHLVRNSRSGVYLCAAVLGNLLVLPRMEALTPLPDALLLGLRLAAIVSFALMLLQLGRGVRNWLDEQFDISAADNLRSRRMRTQIGFVERIFDVAVVVIAVAVLLAQFEGGRKLSNGLLASAGVASLVIGFAAQRSIANLLAGFQIAFTQPIRIDDAVVVENEWGWIEEISLTYVVVRVWDRRRLVLPITYFVETPFQNWTRKSGQILGSVFLEVAHHTPFEPLNRELNRLLDENPLWDRDARVLQVVEAKERSLQLRALMTARNSPACWDLRCAIRRGLIEFLVREHPDCLPSARIAMVDSALGDSAASAAQTGAAQTGAARDSANAQDANSTARAEPRESWTAPAR